MTPAMRSSPAATNIIAHFEKCVLHAYKPTPNDVWTLGYGHTHGVKEGDTCTHEQAVVWLHEDTIGAESAINRYVVPPLAQHEFDALTSFVFNVGAGAFEGSTMLVKLNESDFPAAAHEFPKWVKQHGVTLPGLVARREAERELFED